MKASNTTSCPIFEQIITAVNLFSMTRNFILDENLESKDVLNPIQEESLLESETLVTDSNIDKDEQEDEQEYEQEDEQEDEQDTKCQFPDTQIKLDLSGPK